MVQILTNFVNYNSSIEVYFLSYSIFITWHLFYGILEYYLVYLRCPVELILGDPGAASRDDGIFMGESLQQERKSPF